MLTLVKPSIRITATSKREDSIPSRDVMESQVSGKNTVGKNLERLRQSCTVKDVTKWGIHNQAKDLIKVSRICRFECFC